MYGTVKLSLAPQFLIRLVGAAAAQFICTVMTWSFYFGLFRLLDKYAPVRVDAVVYIALALVFHVALVTYFSIRKQDN